ncbi:unnamed protein product [Cylicocyclus nassatus]|uniref:Uncharacterized protein n=1 Tax=Cylicocyclus nassatus TaxID=53992 RepID=A0AA36M771_CYLNA|nr:unnamed protein product [Cylicocyclus nassatus]
MNLLVAALPFLVLCVNAQDVFNCNRTGTCPAGLRCSEGRCISRRDCPARGIPQVPLGCKLETKIDLKGCPKTKIVC